MTAPGGVTAGLTRPAEPGDLSRLTELYGLLAEELAGQRGGLVLIGLYGRRGDIPGTFAAQLADTMQKVVVASSRDQVVGYGTCRAVELGERHLVGRVEDLYVAPEHRREGLGRAMAHVLVAWCREKGCVGVDAHALPGSRAVKSFFEEGRFKARLLVMHHTL